MKRRRTRLGRAKAGLVLVCASGFLFQGSGCFSFGLNTALGAFDFCFLLNCNDGALGGLIDFCGPVNFTSFAGMGDGGTDQEGSFLNDCVDEM